MRFGDAEVGVSRDLQIRLARGERKESNMDEYYCILIRSKNTARKMSAVGRRSCWIVGMRRQAILTITIRFCNLCESRKRKIWMKMDGSTSKRRRW